MKQIALMAGLLIAAGAASNDRLASVQAALEETLKDVPGLVVRISNDQVFVESDRPTRAQRAKIQSVVDHYPEARFLVQFEGDQEEIIARTIQRKIGLSTVTVELRDNKVTLTGTAPDASQMRRAEAICRVYVENAEIENRIQIWGTP